MSKYIFGVEDPDIRYPDDVDRFVEVFEARGHTLSEKDAYLAWEAYSESMCAGWLMSSEYKDGDLFDTLCGYLTKL